MTASRRFTLTFVAAFALGGGGMASAYHTSFVANNCNSAAPTPTPYITRDGSAARVEVDQVPSSPQSLSEVRS